MNTIFNFTNSHTENYFTFLAFHDHFENNLFIGMREVFHVLILVKSRCVLRLTVVSTSQTCYGNQSKLGSRIAVRSVVASFLCRTALLKSRSL